MSASDFRLLARPVPLSPDSDMPDRFRVTLAGMRTEPWLLYGAWAVGGVVLWLLGHWQIGVATSLVGAACDFVFQRRLKALARDLRLGPDEGVARLTPIVAVRFFLGVSGALLVVANDQRPATVVAVLMLQAWSICVALAQFCAVPRLFFIAIGPPLVTVLVSIWPYLSGPAGGALLLSLGLLILMLAVIGRQVGRVWAAWRESWLANSALIADLKAARVAAEAASRAKSTFLATMSHEVRTPLNGILGMAQVMALHPLDAEQQERVKIIQRSGETLLETLNAVLDLARIEAGRLDIVDGIIDPAALVSEVVEAFEPSARLKGLSLTGDCDETAEGVFVGDPARLGQVLKNLVGNAVKFTASGCVSVSASADHGRLTFHVRDTGDGIAACDHDRIFQPFEQVQARRETLVDGTGLGLSICRELATLMGGEIGLVSEPGQGSTFRLELPARPQPGRRAHPEPVEPGGLDGAFSVLVAEDNPTNQLVIASLLGHLGADVELVANGRAAIEALGRRIPDVVLMDVQMPEMDGLAATRAIRAGDAGAAAMDLVIIGVTGNAMAHQIEECLAAGMSCVVPKPIQIAALAGALNAQMTAKGPGAASMAQRSHQAAGTAAG